MKLIFLFIIALAMSPLPLFADTGGTVFPYLPCAGQRIECKSWFEEPHACDQYLKNSAYTIVGGSAGASVQNYEFCANSEMRIDLKKTPSGVAVSALLAAIVSGGAFFILWKIKKSRV